MNLIYGLFFATTFLQPKIINKPFPYKYERDTTVNYIVFHYDAGSKVSSTFKHLRRKRNSYHYYIDRNGVLYKLVDPAHEAGHAGLSYYNGYVRLNRYSIGICFQNTGKQEYTTKQYKTAGWLVNRMYQRFPDAIDKPLLGHSDITVFRMYNKKMDPGKRFNWDTLQKYINGDTNEREKVQSRGSVTKSRKKGGTILKGGSKSSRNSNMRKMR